MEIERMQCEIYDNKVRQGFNVRDVGKEIVCLTEELGELSRAYRDSDKGHAYGISNREAIEDAIGDIMVYCLGLCHMMGTNSRHLLERIIQTNAGRSHRSHL